MNLVKKQDFKPHCRTKCFLKMDGVFCSAWDLLSCLACLLVVFIFFIGNEWTAFSGETVSLPVCEDDELLTVWPIKHPPHPSFICLRTRPPMTADQRRFSLRFWILEKVVQR